MSLSLQSGVKLTKETIACSFPAMGSEAKDLHMLFFPFMAQGHMLPLVEMAKLFASRGPRITVLTTPVNAAIIRPTIDDHSVHLHIIPFPSADFGLPEGCENISMVPSYDLFMNFLEAAASLRNPFDSVLRDLRPDCVVTDIFFPWTYHIASARGIPRLIFHGTNYFSRCAENAVERCLQLVDEAPDQCFVLPGIPHRIEMLKTQVMDIKKLAGTPFEIFLETLGEAVEEEPKSFGVVMNSFYELEPEYVDHYRKVMGRRAWSVGPVSLYNKEMTSNKLEQAESANEYLKWLDGKPTGSVVYMCFGSGSLFSVAQLSEMALGLEASGHPFVWVVRNKGDDWVPEGYEERIKGRGMVIRGWAPQLLILNHDAVGGFVTHCGWNSSLEGICAGLPMVTWPLCAEQFYNEKLLVEVLKIGVAVGSKVHTFIAEERPIVEAGAVEAAVRRVMEGGEKVEERRRAKELGKMARKAVEKGGSSYEEIGKLVKELMDWRKDV